MASDDELDEGSLFGGGHHEIVRAREMAVLVLYVVHDHKGFKDAVAVGVYRDRGGDTVERDERREER